VGEDDVAVGVDDGHRDGQVLGDGLGLDAVGDVLGDGEQVHGLCFLPDSEVGGGEFSAGR
jgi:hypothetical protein